MERGSFRVFAVGLCFSLTSFVSSCLMNLSPFDLLRVLLFSLFAVAGLLAVLLKLILAPGGGMRLMISWACVHGLLLGHDPALILAGSLCWTLLVIECGCYWHSQIALYSPAIGISVPNFATAVVELDDDLEVGAGSILDPVR
ncbi:hypothetical protein Nepgr_020395 [Nepenthes gracilis]|uniref:Uncharacterized protein n=1 Tax=Nepenthes gracilis TaxID=150966 RepID=A0AAD3XW11_NEPGR|nr:hypothetical protein Nepgr_020395 [Nepenthes gracilis]